MAEHDDKRGTTLGVPPPVNEPAPGLAADAQPMPPAAEGPQPPACGHDHGSPGAGIGCDPTTLTHDLPAAPPGGGTWSVAQVAAQQQGQAGAAPAAPAHAAIWAGVRVSGRYRATGGAMELELRVDVDGLRPLLHLSGDFFRRRGNTLSYAGSFTVAAPRLTVAQDRVEIEGTGNFSFNSASPVLRVTIAAPTAAEPHPAAAAQFLTATGQPGAQFVCAFESAQFRRVEFELDTVELVTPFDQYDTGLLPSGGPARKLSVPTAYAEAGVEMVHVGAGLPVPIRLAGEDRIWDNAELHAAMVDHFQRWSPATGWRAWLLAATAHKAGPKLRGIMFDRDLRQGCAVFHDAIGGTTDQALRGMLRTYVHELGHCFNLFHPHQKHFMDPPQPDRLDSLSWMQYPNLYESASGSGEDAFWSAFAFQFDTDELVHLRHGFRDAVVPGAQPFGMGAADLAADVFADPVADNSGLRLEIRAPDRFLLGTPVVVEIKLSLTDLRGRLAHRTLHPNMGYVQIGISGPGGTMVYRPLITHCADPEPAVLTEAAPTVYESAYIGYGKDGHYFDAPGRYALRAVYAAPDGSAVVSNTLHLKVLAPLDRQEDELSDLFLGEDQGSLLYLLGSDSAHLASGRRSFQRVLERYPDHPMADYARLVEGFNASRPFKRIEVGDEGPRVAIRAPDPSASTGFLRDLFDSTRQRAQPAGQDYDAPGSRVPQLDNISLNMAAQRLGETLVAQGDAPSAAKAMRELMGFLTATVKVPPHVQALVEQQVARVLGDGAGDAGAGAAPAAPGRRRPAPKGPPRGGAPARRPRKGGKEK